MKAVWNGVTLAESDQTVELEGNHYFPADSINPEFFEDSDWHTTCGWKGLASYKNIVVNGEKNPDAAWYYADPKPAAEEIRGKFGFWRGVTITP